MLLKETSIASLKKRNGVRAIIKHVAFSCKESLQNEKTGIYEGGVWTASLFRVPSLDSKRRRSRCTTA